MSYEEQIKALRHCMTKEDSITICEPCPYYGKGIECENVLHTDAAAAIEALQADVLKYHDAFGRLSKTAVELEQMIVELKHPQSPQEVQDV